MLGAGERTDVVELGIIAPLGVKQLAPTAKVGVVELDVFHPHYIGLGHVARLLAEQIPVAEGIKPQVDIHLVVGSLLHGVQTGRQLLLITHLMIKPGQTDERTLVEKLLVWDS